MKTFLEKVTKETGDILLSFRNKKNNIQTKADSSFVSDADLASEEYIISAIDKNFPGSLIISEESGVITSAENKNGLTWIIDPIDGTTNFLHNFPFYSVSIGVMENNKLIAGAVYNPALGELYTAFLGKGAFLNNMPIKTSSVDNLKESLLITGFYYHEGDVLKTQMDRFKKVQEASKSVRRLGAASLDICYVASGCAEGFWEDGLKPWDVAAGTLILTESGGIFTDLDGNPGNIFGKTFLYSNEKIYKNLLKILKL